MLFYLADLLRTTRKAKPRNVHKLLIEILKTYENIMASESFISVLTSNSKVLRIDRSISFE